MKTEIRIDRLKILIEHLRKMKPESFNFANIITEASIDDRGNICATICCAIGELPKLFPDLVAYRWYNDRPFLELKESLVWFPGSYMANHIFNFPRAYYGLIFYPWKQEEIHPSLKNLPADCLPTQLADTLEKFIQLVEKGEL